MGSANHIEGREVGIITMATGPAKYTHFAIALAHSLRALHRWDGPLAVVSDKELSDFGDTFDLVIKPDPALGTGVEQKLALDIYSPFEETIFIDCDSLAFHPLNAMLAQFRTSGEEFGVLGGHYVSCGDQHYGLPDVDAFLQLFEIDRVPAFNSGIIWWTSSGTRVFQEARNISSRVNDGLVSSFKDARLPDEPIFGAAMERLGVEYAARRTDYLLPTVAAKSLRNLDVVLGVSTLVIDGEVVNPAVVHFNYAGQDSLIYARERIRASNPMLSCRRAMIRSVIPWFVRHGRQSARRRLKAILR